MTVPWKFVLGLSLAICFGPPDAVAGPVLSVSDTTITAGGTGTVDIVLTDDGMGPTSAFSISFVEFLAVITPTGPSDLEFSAAFGGEDLSYRSSPDYVFREIVDEGNTVELFTAYVGDPAMPREFRGEDGFDLVDAVSGDPRNIIVDPAANPDGLLLARLQIRHTVGAGQTGGTFPATMFSINLDPTVTLFEFFDPGDGDFVTGDFASFGSGTVTVVAVPEPSSLAILGCIALGGVYRRRRGQSQSASVKRGEA